MKLKRLEHSYLHELFKAVVLYDAGEVKTILSKEIGGRLLKEWVLDRVYQEIAPAKSWERYNGNCDVLWVLKYPDREEIGHRIIIHEVKTGHYDVAGVIAKYRRSTFSPGGYAAGNARPTSTNTPLYIWAWQKYHASNNTPIERVTLRIGKYQYNKDFDVQKIIARGGVRLLPLDWLLPILEREMEKIYG